MFTVELYQDIDILMNHIDAVLAQSYELEKFQNQNNKSSSYMCPEYKKMTSNLPAGLSAENIARCSYIFDLLESIKRGEGLYRDQFDYFKATQLDFIQAFIRKHSENIPIYTPPSRRHTL